MNAMAARLPTAVASARTPSEAPVAVFTLELGERSAQKYSSNTAIGTIQLPKLTRIKAAP